MEVIGHVDFSRGGPGNGYKLEVVVLLELALFVRYRDNGIVLPNWVSASSGVDIARPHALLHLSISFS